VSLLLLKHKGGATNLKVGGGQCIVRWKGYNRNQFFWLKKVGGARLPSSYGGAAPAKGPVWYERTSFSPLTCNCHLQQTSGALQYSGPTWDSSVYALVSLNDLTNKSDK